MHLHTIQSAGLCSQIWKTIFEDVQKWDTDSVQCTYAGFSQAVNVLQFCS